MLFDRDAQPGKNRPLMAFLIIALLVGAAGSLFSEPNIETWYAGLVKPVFNPPNWVFAPVWTALYILMAVAAWRVFRVTGFWAASPFARSAEKGEVAEAGPGASEGRRGIAPEMWAWMIQLTLNFFWSAIFFGTHQLLLALLELAALWLAVAVTLVMFFRKDRIAGLLLLPYLAWVSFAFSLNWALWRLNG